MKLPMLLATLVGTGLATLGCTAPLDDPAADATSPAPEAVAFTKKVMVLGVPVYATNTTSDEKLLHAAGVLAQFLDNDEDGTPDSLEIHQAILASQGAITMTRTGGERRLIADDQQVHGQGLYDEETNPGARERGEFDTALEEIWHMVTDNGLSIAYPDVFTREPGSEVAAAVDLARGGYFELPPDQYPEDAWYTYYDETCDYDCQISEYVYWSYTTFIGAQDLPGRFDDVGQEWRLLTRDQLREGDPTMFEILSRPEYHLGSVIPDGNYTGSALTIEPYEHQ
jgi:hypothetical protein